MQNEPNWWGQMRETKPISGQPNPRERPIVRNKANFAQGLGDGSAIPATVGPWHPLAAVNRRGIINIRANTAIPVQTGRIER